MLDYVVVKIPRFAFEKFPAADPALTTQMKSVGEVMAIGRTFKEAFQKGLRGLEIDRPGWVIGATPADDRLPDDSLEDGARRAADARPRSGSSRSSARCCSGVSVEAIAERTGIDPWFLHQLRRAGRGGARVGGRRRGAATPPSGAGSAG